MTNHSPAAARNVVRIAISTNIAAAFLVLAAAAAPMHAQPPAVRVSKSVLERYIG